MTQLVSHQMILCVLRASVLWPLDVRDLENTASIYVRVTLTQRG